MKKSWLMLGAGVSVNATIQILWASYMPVAGTAATYYSVSTGAVGWFAMSFMLAFLPFSLPASWLIDNKGIRYSVGLASSVMAVAGIARGLVGDSFALAMVCTAFLAIIQPLFLNSWTAMAAQWFPQHKRAGAVSLLTFGNLLGTGIAMGLTPSLTTSLSIGQIQLVYGSIAALSALFFLAVCRDTGERSEKVLVLSGTRQSLKTLPFVVYLVVIFVGMGLFNGVTTWVLDIVQPRGMGEADAGLLGVIMLVSGLFGAVIMSAISDKLAKRLPFIALALLGTIPGLLGLGFATQHALIYASAAIFGFFLTSAFPIGMQYSAEITAPVPEGTTNGIIQLVGQGGVVIVYLMEAVGNFPLVFDICAVVLGTLAITMTLSGRHLQPHLSEAKL